MPRCYIVKKPLQQYSNFTILKNATSIMASSVGNEKTTSVTTATEETTGPISPTEACVAPTYYNTLENQSKLKILFNSFFSFFFLLLLYNDNIVIFLLLL